ncbi:MAG TPA: CHASE2 domain-containing protein, partial [Anaerolineae bacterium]|nr:CHASE2 domain-containing protein [Anaerolineae bacterium]
MPRVAGRKRYYVKRIFHLPGLAITLIVIAVFMILYHLKPFPLERLDLVIHDSMFRLRGPVEGDKRIVIVAIDKKSIHLLGKWPWPRSVIASLIETVSDARPATIVIDFLFAGKTRNGDGDRELAKAIGRAGNVVIPYLFYLNRLEAQHQSRQDVERGLAAVRSSVFNQIIETGPATRRWRVFEATGIEAPLLSVARAAAASGFYNIL